MLQHRIVRGQYSVDKLRSCTEELGDAWSSLQMERLPPSFGRALARCCVGGPPLHTLPGRTLHL